jgi:hypothetical protein
LFEQPLDSKRYQRIWKRGDVKKLFEFSQSYLQSVGKSIENFDIEDVRGIAEHFN